MFSRSTDRKIIQLLSEIRYSEHEDSIPIIGRFLSAYLGDKDSLDLLVEEGLTYYDTVESSFLSYLKSISMYVDIDYEDHWSFYDTSPRVVLGYVLEKLRQDTVDFTVLGMFILNSLSLDYEDELIDLLGSRYVSFKDFKDFCLSCDYVSVPNSLEMSFYEDSSLNFDIEILQFIACFACSENKELISRFLSAYLGDEDSLDSLVEEGLTYYDNLESSFLSYLRSDSVSGFGGDSSSVYLFDREVLFFCSKAFYFSDVTDSTFTDLLYIYLNGVYDHVFEWVEMYGFITSPHTFSADFRKYFADIFYREGGFRLCMRL